MVASLINNKFRGMISNFPRLFSRFGTAPGGTILVVESLYLAKITPKTGWLSFQDPGYNIGTTQMGNLSAISATYLKKIRFPFELSMESYYHLPERSIYSIPDFMVVAFILFPTRKANIFPIVLFFPNPDIQIGNFFRQTDQSQESLRSISLIFLQTPEQ